MPAKKKSPKTTYKAIAVDVDYLKSVLITLLNIASPSGYSDQIVHFVGETLEKFGVQFNVTRRGSIRATIPGKTSSSDRAVAVHLDTLGAMVSGLKENGRLQIAPVGHWSSRFAEGARVTVFADDNPVRGTILTLKASGHVYNDEIDSQPVSWDQLEIRVDEQASTRKDLEAIGIDVGDFVAFDATPEITDSGYINARHLDDKAGVAVLLAVIKAIREEEIDLPMECHFYFTIFEEVGLGASSGLYSDISEMVVLDIAPLAEIQNGNERGATICMMDQSGPYDYHLNRKLISICKENDLEYTRDIFKYYRSDSASVIEAGNDTRTALIGFGLDGSHGYERVHIDSLLTTAQVLSCYLQSPPTFDRDKDEIASLEGFPHQPTRDTIQIKT
jgi:peptidase M42 family hydrolase